MTLVVSCLCSDGVVVASDSMLTNSMGNLPTAETKGKKVYPVQGDQLFAFAGNPGLATRFRIMQELVSPQLGSSQIPIDYATNVSRAVHSQFQQTHQGFPCDLNAFVAFVHSNNFHCAFFDQFLQYRFLDEHHYWMAIGSGKQYADPFMAFLTKLFCPTQPTVAEAKFLIVWCLSHVIETNTGGIDGPIQMSVLRQGVEGIFEVKELDKDDIDDQEQAVGDAVSVLQDWRSQLSGSAVGDRIAPPPSPSE